MNANKVKTFKQLQDYIEGCLNDYESNISTKTETIAAIIELCFSFVCSTNLQWKNRINEMIKENNKLKLKE